MSAAPTTAPPGPQPGDHVELTVCGERAFGVVDFIDGGWVHWTDSTGRPHATRPNALRIRFPAELRAEIDRWGRAR